MLVITLARACTLHSVIHIQVTKSITKKLNTCAAEQTAAFLFSSIPPLSASHHSDQFGKDRIQTSIFILVWILSPAAARAWPVH